MVDQPRWPRGTPVAPGGRGPGGGRFRGEAGDWAGSLSGLLSRRSILRMSDETLDLRGADAIRIAQSIPDTRTVHRPGLTWTEEREKMHDRILRRVMARYRDTPTQRRAMMTGGLPGAGKTSTLGSQMRGYMPIDPDELKEEIVAEGGLPDLPGTQDLSPMELSPAFHIESTYLADRLLEMAVARGRNVLVDATMGTPDAPAARLRRLHQAGYRVRGAFVDVSIEVSARRAAARYRAQMRQWARGEGFGGRPIPPEFIRRSEDPQHPRGWTRNRQVFDQLVADGWFDDGWSLHDNSGSDPVLVASDVSHGV